MSSNLPVKKDENFVGEFEVMDLSAIRTDTFLVAVSQGDRSGPKFVSSTIRGPYSFVEMLQQVGDMWVEEQHHAKVLILEKNRTKRIKSLDQNTVDYIEAHYIDLITEEMLNGAFDLEKEFTCRAGLVESDRDNNVVEEKVDELLPDALELPDMP